MSGQMSDRHHGGILSHEGMSCITFGTDHPICLLNKVAKGGGGKPFEGLIRRIISLQQSARLTAHDQIYREAGELS